MLVICLVLIVVLAALEALYWIAAFVVLWALPLFCGLAAMQFVLGLHLSDPLAPLWALLGGALLGRLVLGLVLSRLSRTDFAPTPIVRGGNAIQTTILIVTEEDHDCADWRPRVRARIRECRNGARL